MDGIGDAGRELRPGGPTTLVRAAVELLVERFFEPLAPANLLREAWDGATAALARVGVAAVPPAPAYPRDGATTYRVHAEAFPALEELAARTIGREALAAAALRELAARRRDGHTFLATPFMLATWRVLPEERQDLGLVLNDAPPLAVADDCSRACGTTRAASRTARCARTSTRTGRRRRSSGRWSC